MSEYCKRCEALSRKIRDGVMDLSRQPMDEQLLSPHYHFGVAEALKKELDEAYAAAEMLSPNRAIQYAYCAEALRRASEEIGRLKARIATLEAQRGEGE